MIYNEKVILNNPTIQQHFEEITPQNLSPFPKNPTICKFMIQIGRFDELGSGVTKTSKRVMSVRLRRVCACGEC